MKPNRRKYSEVRDSIPHGAVLLFRPDKFSLQSFRWIWGKGIAKLGRSEYCHAGMVDTCAGYPEETKQINCLEVLEGSGGRDRLLSDVLADHYPGQIDVYKVAWGGRFVQAPSIAVNRMRELVALPYGWWDMFRIVIRRMVFLRFLFRTPTHDDNGRVRSFVCSGAVAAASQAGGLDPVPNLPPEFVEPGDLARSLGLRYEYTLLPE